MLNDYQYSLLKEIAENFSKTDQQYRFNGLESLRNNKKTFPLKSTNKHHDQYKELLKIQAMFFFNQISEKKFINPRHPKNAWQKPITHFCIKHIDLKI